MWSLDDGSMTQKDREASLNKIRTSQSTRVILISFKAGSTGRSGDNMIDTIDIIIGRSEFNSMQQRDPS